MSSQRPRQQNTRASVLRASAAGLKVGVQYMELARSPGNSDASVMFVRELPGTTGTTQTVRTVRMDLWEQGPGMAWLRIAI